MSDRFYVPNSTFQVTNTLLRAYSCTPLQKIFAKYCTDAIHRVSVHAITIPPSTLKTCPVM